jgi:DNA-binding beta-propeller fold protein YncE
VSATSERLMVADTGNHRVLLFDRKAAGDDANVALGQTSFLGILPNQGASVSASALSSPEAVTEAAGRIYVADTGNHRVLIWNSKPSVSGQAADVVLGQENMAGSRANRGQALASDKSMFSPVGLLVQDDKLYVADSGNNRVLVFSATVNTSGASAMRILGQSSATARTPSNDEKDLKHLSGPVGLAADGTYLYVTERDTPRISVFPLKVEASFGEAIVAIDSTLGASLGTPYGIAAVKRPYFQTRLFVTDTKGERTMVLGPVRRTELRSAAGGSP